MSAVFDAIVIAAGAAGMLCAATAGQRGKRVLLIDLYHKVGEKIRFSGGGRCNFTHLHTHPDNLISENRNLPLRAGAIRPERFYQAGRKTWHQISRKNPCPTVLRDNSGDIVRLAEWSHHESCSSLNLLPDAKPVDWLRAQRTAKTRLDHCHAIRQMMTPPAEKKQKIGFIGDD